VCVCVCVLLTRVSTDASGCGGMMNGPCRALGIYSYRADFLPKFIKEGAVYKPNPVYYP
jgi:hypothetical protein